MNYTLQRQSESSEGTFGILLNEQSQRLCYTCELPWNNNMAGGSRIPAGTYQCLPHNGNEWKNVWEVSNVPERSTILIHAGNFASGPKIDTNGCILVGNSIGWIGTQEAVLNSLETLNYLRTILPPTFTLIINDIAKIQES